MIPSSFDYAAPDSVENAVAALASTEESKVLAGGQSFIPVLRLRMAHPDLVVDLRRIDELKGVSLQGDRVVIGAMTTHHQVTTDPIIAEHLPLLAAATATVADPAIRHRGTFGGAIAHADPAGDLLSVAIALDAQMSIAGLSGRRTVPAAEFFTDFLTTAVGPDEVLVSVSFPSFAGWGVHYEKFNRTAQSWAIVGVAAAVKRSNGTIEAARIGLTNMGPTPVRASAVEAALIGAAATIDTVSSAAQAADQGTSPTSDLNAAADYRKHLAKVLTGRAVATAAHLV